MNEWYRPAKVYLTLTTSILVNDEMSEAEQEKRLVDMAIDEVECLDNRDVCFEYAEFQD